MQTFLVHPNYDISASYLDSKRLFSQIYESIHILASLTGACHVLVNPKRDVSNHPVAKLWKGHEASLYAYAATHYNIWLIRHPQTQTTINGTNLERLKPYIIGSYDCPILDRIPYYKLLLKAKDKDFYCGL